MVGLCFVSNTEKEQISTKMAICTKGNGNGIKCTVMEFIHTLTEECEWSSLNWLSPKPVIVYWYDRTCLLKQGSNQDATSHVNNAMQLSVTKTSHASSQLPIRFEFSKAKVFNIDIETLRNHLHASKLKHSKLRNLPVFSQAFSSLMREGASYLKRSHLDALLPRVWFCTLLSWNKFSVHIA